MARFQGAPPRRGIEWTPVPPNPKGYSHPELLVTPAELADTLRQAELAGRDAPLLLDGRPADAFARGQIAGSVHVDLWGVSLTDTDPAPLRAFLWMIHHVLAQRGLHGERAVVLIDQQSGLRAARAFWFLGTSATLTCRCWTGASTPGGAPGFRWRRRPIPRSPRRGTRHPGTKCSPLGGT